MQNLRMSFMLTIQQLVRGKARMKQEESKQREIKIGNIHINNRNNKVAAIIRKTEVANAIKVTVLVENIFLLYAFMQLYIELLYRIKS